ncbi:MAG: hypothetical protein U0Q16_09895 [Bryobacteraceae bacterium]
MPIPEPPEVAQYTPIPADRSNRSYTSYENPIPLVVAELNKLGIDSSQLKMELVDEHLVTWGGALTNHFIRTTFPSGIKEDFSLEWTLRNPKVTAVDMQRILRNGNRIA